MQEREYDESDIGYWTCPKCKKTFAMFKPTFTGRVMHRCGVEPQKPKMQGAGDLLATVIKVASGGHIRPCTACEKRRSALNRLIPFKFDKTNEQN